MSKQWWGSWRRRGAVLAGAVGLLVGCAAGPAAAADPGHAGSSDSSDGSGSAAPAYVEQDYQDPVSAVPPVSRPDTRHCTVTVMKNDFANTISQPPWSGTATPPKQCRGPWSKVVLDWSGSVSGRQYDRLAGVWLGGAEIFRTSTPEPTADGVSWHVDKDITEFGPLLKDPQQLVVSLGNVVNETYTGIYHMAMTFTYYMADAKHPAAQPADRIVPLAKDGAAPGDAGWMSVNRGQAATAHVVLPRNTERARLELYARGGGCDEQWFTAVPDDLAATAPDYLCGGGPYREVRVDVDGRPAGLAQPYPVVYSGGIVPTLWRPIAAIDQFRTEPYQLDLSPFAGVLADGKPHTVTVTPVGNSDNWNVGGQLFVDTDHGRATTGGAVASDTLTADPAVATTEAARADGGTDVRVSTSRDWSISGYVNTSHGRVTTTVTQHAGYLNTDAVSATGQHQVMSQRDNGWTTVTRGHHSERASWSYPIDVDVSVPLYQDGNNYRLQATVMQGRTLASAVRNGPDAAWRTVSDSNDVLHASGVLARTGGVVVESDGSGDEHFHGTTDTGACWDHLLAANHGWLTQDTSGGCEE